MPFNNSGYSNTAGVGTDIGALINGVKIDWGPYNPAHVYSTLFIGLGDTIDIGYQDTAYSDNVGNLLVQIATVNAIPVPAALPLFLSGLVAIGFFRRRAARARSGICA